MSLVVLWPTPIGTDAGLTWQQKFLKIRSGRVEWLEKMEHPVTTRKTMHKCTSPSLTHKGPLRLFNMAGNKDFWHYDQGNNWFPLQRVVQMPKDVLHLTHGQARSLQVDPIHLPTLMSHGNKYPEPFCKCDCPNDQCPLNHTFCKMKGQLSGPCEHRAISYLPVQSAFMLRVPLTILYVPPHNSPGVCNVRLLEFSWNEMHLQL